MHAGAWRKTRIKLLLAIGHEPRPVEALADAVNTSQQNASKHLLALHRAGVILRRPRGREVLYSLVDYDTVRLVAAVRSLALRRLRQTRRDKTECAPAR
jgi:DNA-binding transcriptional ArsR family regulator